MGAHHLVKRGMSGPSITLWTVLLGGLSLGICALALYRSRSGGRKKLEFVCLWGTVYLLAGLAAINIIKAVWQRTRFDDMLTAAGGGFEGDTYFIQKANEFKSGIWVEKDERRVNAKSLLGVLSLGIVKGTTITLIADGPDAKEAVESLTQLVSDQLGE